jgi:hypothetical protein
MVTSTTAALPTKIHHELSRIEEGLDYILSHFEGQRSWPRTISTKTTENRQSVANSREEALARFAQAKWLDCRISAYPMPSELSYFVGANLDIAPSIVMIDLDRKTFRTQRALGKALSKTINRINWDLSNCQPTVIWSGSGYHIYITLDAFVLEREDVFNNSKFGSNPSQRFIRFAEWFLTNGKCDPQHNRTVSLKNCMLRIPGSTNSRNGQTVRIAQKWNGYKPSIKLLLEDFYVYLSDQRIKELNEKRCQEFHKLKLGSSVSNNIHWIERLLQTAISDFRKLIVWRILAPYLLNVRSLSYGESYTIISEWLDKCNRLRGLDFNPDHRIRSALTSSKDFLPISYEKLRTENEGLYNLLLEHGVMK